MNIVESTPSAQVKVRQKRLPSRIWATNDKLLADFLPHALAIEETPPSRFTGVIISSLALFLLAIITWAWNSRLPIMTTAPGKFDTGMHTKVVQSLNSGTVKDILVKPGDHVAKGQVLVDLDPKVNYAQLNSARSDLGMNSLLQQRALSEIGGRSGKLKASDDNDAMVALENNVARSELATQRSKIASDRAKIDQARANMEAGKTLLTEYKERLVQDQDLATKSRPLVAEGALSGEHFTKINDQLIVDQGQLMAQYKQVKQLNAAVVAARKQLDMDKRSFISARYQELESNTVKSYDLMTQFKKAAHNVSVDQLRSPITGVVQSLDVVSLGSVVQPGQTVATIEPVNSQLDVEADVPAQSIGFIKVGQKTKIKITAYPFEQYGSIPGVVEWISPAADSMSSLTSLPAGESHQPASPPSQNAAQADPGQPKSASPPVLYYRIKVKPERTWLEVEGQRRQLHPGMTVSVDIETGHRRIIEFFLDPIIKYVQEGTAVR